MNRLCANFNRYLDKDAGHYKQVYATGDYNAEADIEAKYQARSSREINHDIALLQPSPPDQNAFDRYLHALRQQNGLYARLITALRAHSTVGVQTINRLLNSNDRPRISAAIDLGAEKCGAP